MVVAPFCHAHHSICELCGLCLCENLCDKLLPVYSLLTVFLPIFFPVSFSFALLSHASPSNLICWLVGCLLCLISATADKSNLSSSPKTVRHRSHFLHMLGALLRALAPAIEMRVMYNRIFSGYPGKALRSQAYVRHVWQRYHYRHYAPWHSSSSTA